MKTLAQRLAHIEQLAKYSDPASANQGLLLALVEVARQLARLADERAGAPVINGQAATVPEEPKAFTIEDLVRGEFKTRTLTMAIRGLDSQQKTDVFQLLPFRIKLFGRITYGDLIAGIHDSGVTLDRIKQSTLWQAVSPAWREMAIRKIDRRKWQRENAGA